MQIPDLNPNSIADPVTHQIVIQLLDMIETLPAKHVALRVENQDLCDDVWHDRRDSRGSLISNYPRCRLHRLPIIPRKRSAARARPEVNETLIVTHTAAELQPHLILATITLNRQQQQVGDALAVAAYHAQTQVPMRGWLLSDDTPINDHLTNTHTPCWVHDWRHYAKLAPRVPHYQGVVTPVGVGASLE